MPSYSVNAANRSPSFNQNYWNTFGFSYGMRVARYDRNVVGCKRMKERLQCKMDVRRADAPSSHYEWDIVVETVHSPNKVAYGGGPASCHYWQVVVTTHKATKRLFRRSIDGPGSWHQFEIFMNYHGDYRQRGRFWTIRIDGQNVGFDCGLYYYSFIYQMTWSAIADDTTVSYGPVKWEKHMYRNAASTYNPSGDNGPNYYESYVISGNDGLTVYPYYLIMQINPG